MVLSTVLITSFLPEELVLNHCASNSSLGHKKGFQALVGDADAIQSSFLWLCVWFCSIFCMWRKGINDSKAL